jgi:hypothetical protein
MAFGIRRGELEQWKEKVSRGEISFLTHYWFDPRFPEYNTVTKVGCSDIGKLVRWGKTYGLKSEWIHYRSEYPHYDLLGEKQKEILLDESLGSHLSRFRM